MIISRGRSYIFVHIPKTGGTALSLAWRARSRRRAGWRVIVPFMVLALDDADHVAEALRARGGIGLDNKI